jgi:hypothetical protein
MAAGPFSPCSTGCRNYNLNAMCSFAKQSHAALEQSFHHKNEESARNCVNCKCEEFASRSCHRLRFHH